uniref:Uncharacterized protein n=1 Tax=Coprothermobacter proteolyticus (strain ATCC 35245 / DSM 5265 / OCM 4 / BT) TaxID=309798 RepID=B5YA01_COPPD
MQVAFPKWKSVVTAARANPLAVLAMGEEKKE